MRHLAINIILLLQHYSKMVLYHLNISTHIKDETVLSYTRRSLI